MEIAATQMEKHGIDAWFDLDDSEFIGADAGEYDKVTDVLDVWFDSGATHFSVLDRRDDLTNPAAMYLEGSDQHRGWFQSSLLVSVAITGKAPYEAVLTHGFTTDGEGRKMSKSMGNIIEPQEVIKTRGADVLRLWVCATDYVSEMHISEEILTRITDYYRRIRNTARFMLANLDGFEPAEKLGWNDMLALDQWAVSSALGLQRELIQDYGEYQFHVACRKIHQFCVDELGGFYLDIVKDRLYTMPKDSPARRSAQTAMHHILEAFVRWIAPVLSFTAEELWKFVPGQRRESVMLDTWYEGWPEDASVDMEFWSRIIAIRGEVNRELETLRTKGEIGSPLDADVAIYASGKDLEALQGFGEELKFLMITSGGRAISADDRPPDAVETEIAGIALSVRKTGNPKCSRCWHQTDDVGNDPEHPDICARCVSNVSGAGEDRRHF